MSSDDEGPARTVALSRNNLSRMSDGVPKQHFIELDSFMVTKGKLYATQLLGDNWSHHHQKNENNENEDANLEKEKEETLFQTEVNEKIIQDARKRLESTLIRSIYAKEKSDTNNNNNTHGGLENYLIQSPKEIKNDLIERANKHYKEAVSFLKSGNFEKSISYLNRAFSLNSFNIQFYLLKCECFIQLCDFKSAILTINKLLSVISMWIDKSDSNYDELKMNLLTKIAFCYYAQGQTYYDSKFFIEALESFNKASELLPSSVNYKIRSVSCLFAMGRINEAINLINTIMNENQNDPSLFVLRARLYIKNGTMTECFYDLKKALLIEPNFKDALSLLEQLEETAEQLRNSALVLSINNRISDALNKISAAIAMNPERAEYNLQRGILYKRLKDFNSAIDEFLIGLEKMNNDQAKDPNLFANFQRHILLTYNDFAIVCYEKTLYDDAIILLNKAIKIEKNEKGFYVNRGDCFHKKGEIRFALLDLEQAYEIDKNDESIQSRLARIYYEIGVEKYNEKEYEEATKNFDMAIRYSPKTCKYYISRARTHFFLDEKSAAQLDICVSILLDPTNPEIPAIISRIFFNQNLSDVLTSPQMHEAKTYLDILNIQSVFDLSANNDETESRKSEDTRKYIHLFPDLKQVAKEKLENLELIENKKKINSILKESSIMNLAYEKPKLKPLPNIPAFTKKDQKQVNWKTFNSSISSTK